MKIISLLITVILCISLTAVDQSLRNEIQHSMTNSIKWLLSQQEENGSWENDPAITALVVTSMLRSHPNVNADFPEIEKGLTYIVSCQKTDGAIYLENLSNYITSVCLVALKEANNERYSSAIKKAEKYLLQYQIDENEGYSPDSLFYGGVGYGGDSRPDLSNLQFAMEAVLYEREEVKIEEKQEINFPEEKGLFLEKALIFINRCQNFKSHNKEEYALDDGGFMYEPGKSKIGGVESYGSMTYAGLKSLLYAKVSRDDPRVKAAFEWIRQHYTVTSTPKWDDTALFYYYHTMAKCLQAYGEDSIIDINGKEHNWRTELAAQLIKIQDEEGWWQNTNGRYWENNKVLVTAYCILALEEIVA
ncbi:MAG: hypothetical protein K9G38_00435 [Bacteroidales bacterium]|nr:hypothetical protein [Bacteroidales bacterium]